MLAMRSWFYFEVEGLTLMMYIDAGNISILDVSFEAAQEWAAGIVQDLTLDYRSHEDEDRTEIYHGWYDGRPVSLSLDTLDSEGHWRGVAFSSEQEVAFPWNDDVELGRLAFAHFHRPVRCSARPHLPEYQGDRSMQIDEGGEHLVDWGKMRRFGESQPDARAFLLLAVAANRPAHDVIVSWLDLRGVDLSGLVADRLTAMGTRFDGALLTGASLVEADMAEAVLDGAHLDGANLKGAVFDKSSLRRASLRKAQFADGDCLRSNLEASDWTEAELTKTSFHWSRLTGARLRGVRAGRGNFNGSQLAGADLRDGCFRNASFAEANLMGADLSGSDCTGANFSNAVLTNVRWDGARMVGAVFTPHP